MTPPTTIIALMFGPDQPGLVATVSRWIFENGGNIIHADQHRDAEELIFFQRVEWSHADADDQELRRQAALFRAAAEALGMAVQITLSTDRPRIAVMVTKADHCFHDLALRWRAGELPCDLVCVISNHDDLRPAVQTYDGIAFHHVPKSKANKPAAEAEELAILQRHRVDLVVLARYMQVLTPDFLAKSGPVINIHHSFLPAFAGANPYRQAHARGVKLIGATAHYVTPELDEGPIIHQAVDDVSHRHDVTDLRRKGANLEKVVLSTAVLLHLQCRVLAYGRKTVTFD